MVQSVLRAAQGIQTFRLDVPILSHAYGLLQEFIPVVFDYREHDLRCGGLLLGQGQQGLRDHGVVGGVQAGVLVVLVCDGHVHALTQLTCQWTQLSCRWTHLSCRRTQLWSRRDRALVSEDTALMWLFSLPVVVPQMRLLDRSVDPCGGDYTGAVLVLE